MVASLRGSRRGAMTDPLRMISNQAPSSCRIGPGRSRTAALNQRTMAGSRSSSSIPASASTSATTAAECLICDSRATSLRRIAAPGVSWMPSMIRIARWTLSALPLAQPKRGACSRTNWWNAASSAASGGGGNPSRIPARMSRGQSNKTSWQCGTGRSRLMSGGTVFFTYGCLPVPSWWNMPLTAKNSCCPCLLASARLT